jgi:hypothetical protein
MEEATARAATPALQYDKAFRNDLLLGAIHAHQGTAVKATSQFQDECILAVKFLQPK